MSKSTIAALAAIAGCTLVVGCPKPPPASSVVGASAAAPPAPDAGADASPQPIAAEPLVVLTDRAVGPYLAWSGDGGLVAYVGGRSGSRAVMTIALGARGEALSPPRPVASVGTDANALIVRRVAGQRYVIAWTSLTDKGEALSVLTVAADGALVTAPSVVAQTADDIVWSDVLTTASGAVCVWAEQTRGGDANVLAVGLGAGGQPRGVAGAIARGVVGWQATRADAGVGVAVLRSPKVKPAVAARTTGSLGWLRLDAEGRAVGEMATIVAADVVGVDFDVARIASPAGDSFVFGWTDRGGLDPEVALTSLAPGGAPSKITLLDAGQGGHALVGLASNEAGAVVLWEDARARDVATKRVHTALIRDPRDLSAVAVRGPALDVRSGEAPETRPSRDGFAWLAPSPACLAEPCAGAPVRPVFLRFDRDLSVAQADVLATPEGGSALAWSLDCEGDRCAALTASGAAETRVSFIDLAPHASRIRPPLALAQSPALASLVTLTSGGTITDVAAVTQNGLPVVASLARADGAKSDDSQALSLYLPGRSPAQSLKPLSLRATATGSVAMAPTADGAVIAWVFREGRDAQLHAARVDATGKRTRDVTLTTSSGAKTDVAIAAVDGGFVVAWVDSRDGNGEVYALRIGADLSRVGREERITTAPGDASDLALAGLGDRVIAAWADPRESAADGFADIYAASIFARDGKPAAREARVLATSAHSRSPALASSGGEALLVWIEDAPPGGAGRSDAYGAMSATLDAAARPKGDPQRLRFGVDGLATSITLDATAKVPRGVVAIGDAAELRLWLFSLTSGKVDARLLVALDGPPSLDVPLALTGRDLLFGDDGPEASDARLRYGTLSKDLAP